MQYQHIGYRLKGFYYVSNMGLRHGLLMLSEAAKNRVKILDFWEKHGFIATNDAFGISRRTLFYWKRRLEEGNREPASLNPDSHQPKRKRKRNLPSCILAEIRRLRQVYRNIGKDKIYVFLQPFCETRGLDCPSISTVGRIIKDAPDRMRIIPEKIKPKTGKVIHRTKKKVKRKPKGFQAKYPGHCVAFDTVEIRNLGKKCYIKTFTDLYSRFSFAYSYKKNNSLVAKEFLDMVLKIFPAKIENVLTDNGSEFTALP